MSFMMCAVGAISRDLSALYQFNSVFEFRFLLHEFPLKGLIQH